MIDELIERQGTGVIGPKGEFDGSAPQRGGTAYPKGGEFPIVSAEAGKKKHVRTIQRIGQGIQHNRRIHRFDGPKLAPLDTLC